MYAIIAVLALILIYAVWAFNGLVSLRARARSAWADIDVQLKRRHDLVPNLVTTVQGYASHEKAVLEDVARFRSQAMEARSTPDIAGKEDGLTVAIKSLFAVAESYPNLRADANFRQLQTQLTEIEDNIQYARRYYNAVVRDLNTRCEAFPSNIIASLFGFHRLPYFEAGADERNPADVKF